MKRERLRKLSFGHPRRRDFHGQRPDPWITSRCRRSYQCPRLRRHLEVHGIRSQRDRACGRCGTRA